MPVNSVPKVVVITKNYIFKGLSWTADNSEMTENEGRERKEVTRWDVADPDRCLKAGTQITVELIMTVIWGVTTKLVCSSWCLLIDEIKNCVICTDN